MREIVPDLLFELYVEELPASYLDKAIAGLSEKVPAKLQELRVVDGQPRVRVSGTPRRIAVHAAGLLASQLGQEEELTGPPVSAAFKDGKPTKAAEAFAAKVGVPLDQIEQKDTPKGKYLFGRKRSVSRPTGEILSTLLVELLQGIEFPKGMVWVPGSKLRFPRPLRSIVALLGGEVVGLEWNGVKSGRTTQGHPFLAPGPIELRSASWDEYTAALEARKVVVDRDARRARVRELVKKELGKGEPNDKVVATSANLVEWPEVMTGEFEKRFLDIPAGVIVSAIEHHLRAFPLWDKAGNLQNKFAFVCNRPPHDVIRKGNERVLRARLSDAHFFYEKDQKTSLEELAPRLKDMVFQRDLGSYWDKQERVGKLASLYGDPALVGPAAAVMKADLVTEVVGEFPELQGEVGAVYAKKQGLPAEVAAAIREAYLPKGEGDALPETRTGIALSLAEKADNVVGAFATGMKPTGSKDPLGVRRQVIGILRILRDRKLGFSPADLFLAATRQLPDAVLVSKKKPDPKAPPPDMAKLVHALADEVVDFAKTRLETMAREEGHKPDLIAAVLKAGWSDVPDFWARLEALGKLAGSARFKDLVQLVERLRNITKEVPPGEPTAAALSAPAEKDLFAAWNATRADLDALIHARDYVRAGELYEKTFTTPVEKFMKDVFVNDKDPAVATNRKALLRSVHRLLSERFADLAEAVVAKG